VIRIDLGKSAEDKGAAKKAAAVPKIDFSKYLKFNKAELGGTLLLIGALGFAFLPYLFVEQYKTSFRQRHATSLTNLTDAENHLKEEIEKYKPFQAEQENFERQKALVSRRLAAVNEVLGARGEVVNILDATGQSVPSNAWLSEIRLESTPIPSLTLSGYALTPEAISDFVDRLSSSIYLEKVNLEEVGAIKADIGEHKTFSITAIPKNFRSYAPAKAEGEGAAANEAVAQPQENVGQ